MGDLKVTQVKSAIGTKPKHRGTLRALGLRGIGKSNVLPDRPEIRGMIARVPHLITVEEVEVTSGGAGVGSETIRGAGVGSASEQPAVERSLRSETVSSAGVGSASEQPAVERSLRSETISTESS
jgi:large subunit ribosomal protein L30